MGKQFLIILWALFNGLDGYANSNIVCSYEYRWIYLQPGMAANALLEGNANLHIDGRKFEIDFASDKQQVDPFIFKGHSKENSKIIYGELTPPNSDLGFIFFKGEADTSQFACAKPPKVVWLFDRKNGGYILLRTKNKTGVSAR